MKISNDKRKALRLLCFLLSALLVMTVSASVYNYMYMQATSIGAETADVQFVTATDSTAAGASIGTDGTYVSFNSMAGWPNSTRVYQDAVGIQNSNTTSAYTFELKFDQAGDWSGDTSDIYYIYVKVFNTMGGSQQGTAITVGSAGSTTGGLSLPASTTWHVQWEIKWKAGTLSTKKVSVKLTLIVTGE
jgi:hypothetical protein